MKSTPINGEVVKKILAQMNLGDLGAATIREVVKVVDLIEEASGEKFIRMEMGVPGLDPVSIGVEAEIAALKRGVARDYPSIEGVKELKEEASRFVKNFMNIDVDPLGCIATVGSMQGGYAVFLAASHLDPKKDTALFIDPGFPVQKQQYQMMGRKYTSFDVYEFRGNKLRDKLESFLKEGNINSIIYSNPNNPSWVCLTSEELQIIGELATKYDVLVVEDLAYFGMDFREDYSVPGKAPYQPSVANYTDNWVMLISSSKVFSYAGQRMAVLVISDKIYKRDYPHLKERFGVGVFGTAIVYRLLYSLSSGASHSAQYALAAMFKAANKGEYNFVSGVKEYGKRAQIMKKLFVENGFTIIYDKDMEQPLADGFYFTIGYPGLKGGELIEKLLYYGISAISLKSTGSAYVDGLRACVSQVNLSMIPMLEERLKAFNAENPIK
ncbi:MAG: pyridoxal phosphate-dependent aminotransferase [Salinivirgaceae bacterium]|nr:pyridoxal phosphate-dependent aminotransferase [Salinivirgaceae bacterium]MDD4747839.1 pyridoxal phosphate-dependent aminotransferase [Salinivirgaceae bacterium]MDY0280700.1 pyridoxal phosphate-dependent aminotransferase [Salinivirgaceae bacterium]